jgi:phospholipid transport system substrate-binding protein
MLSQRIFLKTLFFLIVVTFLPLDQGAFAADGPRAPVETFHSALITSMKDAATKDAKARYSALEPAVGQAFHMPLIARLATSEFWDKATDDQRKRLVQAFQRFGISRLVTLFDGYSGESFETVGDRAGSQGTHVVLTKLHLPGKKPVGITYILKEADKRWYIIDALLDDNISELSVRRSEYRRILLDQGVDSLITVLDTKSKELLNG